jgi:hypothetical protein
MTNHIALTNQKSAQCIIFVFIVTFSIIPSQRLLAQALDSTVARKDTLKQADGTITPVVQIQTEDYASRRMEFKTKLINHGPSTKI